MTEIDKKNLKNYLYFTFGITYIAWGLLAIFTQFHILGLETFIGRILHIVGALGPAIASAFYLKRNNIKFKHYVFSKKEKRSDNNKKSEGIKIESNGTVTIVFPGSGNNILKIISESESMETAEEISTLFKNKIKTLAKS